MRAKRMLCQWTRSPSSCAAHLARVRIGFQEEKAVCLVSSPPHQEYCRDGSGVQGTPGSAMVLSLQFAVLI